MEPHGLKICLLVTSSLAAKTLYTNQVRFLVEAGYDVTFICSPGAEVSTVVEQGAKYIGISIERKPSLVKDFLSLLKMMVHFFLNRYDLVVVSTPKAGLLGGIAARLMFQKKIIYIVRGRAYEDFIGLKRKVFELLERITCKAAHYVQFITRELRQEFIGKGYVTEKCSFVLLKGSSKGVDTNLFRPAQSCYEKELLKMKLNIDSHDLVITFCARLRKDKGIQDAVLAFNKVSEMARNSLVLLLVGPDERLLDPYDDSTAYEIENNDKVIALGWRDDISAILKASDIFLFPSYREGFGNAIVEASSAGLPVIAYDIPGCREAVEDNETGYLVPNRNVQDLTNALAKLVSSAEERLRLGEAGRIRTQSWFGQDTMQNEILKKYAEIIDL